MGPGLTRLRHCTCWDVDEDVNRCEMCFVHAVGLRGDRHVRCDSRLDGEPDLDRGGDGIGILMTRYACMLVSRQGPVGSGRLVLEASYYGSSSVRADVELASLHLVEIIVRLMCRDVVVIGLSCSCRLRKRRS